MAFLNFLYICFSISVRNSFRNVDKPAVRKQLATRLFQFCFLKSYVTNSFIYLTLKKKTNCYIAKLKFIGLWQMRIKIKGPLFYFLARSLFQDNLDRTPQRIWSTAELEFNRIMSSIVYKHMLEIICSLMGNALLKSSPNTPHLHSLHEIF